MNPTSTLSGPWSRWAIAILALLALVGACYLTWLGDNESPLGCGGESELACDEVLGSRWARWMNLPVSGLAIPIYLAALVVSLFPAKRVSRKVGIRFCQARLMVACLIGGAAVWFIGLQVFVVRSFCPYCMSVHACGIALAGLMIHHARQFNLASSRHQGRNATRASLIPGVAVNRRTRQVKQEVVCATHDVVVAMASGLATLTAFIVVHVMFVPEPSPQYVIEKVPAKVADDALPRVREPDTPTQPEPSVTEVATAKATVAELKPVPVPSVLRKITIPGTERSIDLSEHMLLGSPGAEYIIVKFFDYTCPHCRLMHHHLDAAQKRYGDRLAIALLPVPLNAGCNRSFRKTHTSHTYACLYVRMAITVWMQKRNAFGDFHDWMFQSKRPPAAGTARHHLNQIVGRGTLDDPTLGREVDRHIGRCVDLFEACGGIDQIPKLIFGESVLTGKTASTEEFLQLLDEHFEVGSLPDAGNGG